MNTLEQVKNDMVKLMKPVLVEQWVDVIQSYEGEPTSQYSNGKPIHDASVSIDVYDKKLGKKRYRLHKFSVSGEAIGYKLEEAKRKRG